eukprot:GDKJ01029754.1.p1 GENE.GDKJ01029754.1~~GDKJ01029754.1.p1  ORF type:complete len:853 (-),score=234.67 GDKJ01029754.1:48-2606(-)
MRVKTSVTTAVVLTTTNGVIASSSLADSLITPLSKGLEYCEDVSHTERFKSRSLAIGDVYLGSHFPIKCQTMTTSDTKDVEATLEQIDRIIQAKGELIRMTVQGAKEAVAAHKIRSALEARGLSIPLVADIHFSPKTAIDVVTAVDKVRVNPGNFADGIKRIDAASAEEALNSNFEEGNAAIREAFIPLLKKLKKENRSLRIGTNHGSLSNRILAKYGDTPQGMVASAIEFALIAREYDFHDMIFSMKASNPLVMVRAYRMLVREFKQRDWFYPIHLGVTEAGQGEDGRIKSAVGIGALLVDGIGDTIRVSLTEDPWFELEPCNVLLNLGMEMSSKQSQLAQLSVPHFDDSYRSAIEIHRRPIHLPVQEKEDEFADVRGWMHRDGSVYSRISVQDLASAASLYHAAGLQVAIDGSIPIRALQTADGLIFEGNQFINFFNHPNKEILEAIKNVHDAGVGLFFSWDLSNLVSVRKLATEHKIEFAVIIPIQNLSLASKSPLPTDLPEGSIRYILSVTGYEEEGLFDVVKRANPPPMAVMLSVPEDDRQRAFVHAGRRVFSLLMKGGEKLNHIPLILRHKNRKVSSSPSSSLMKQEQMVDFSNGEVGVMSAAVDLGGLLLDAIGEGIVIDHNDDTGDNGYVINKLQTAELRAASFSILQNARMRRTKTEFVSCPSCGRTLFDLQEVTNTIKALTGHIPGLAIAIMGCIVNGPGEMADADFGYVGGAAGKVDLYVGREVVERGVPNDEAPMRLVNLIKKEGRWVEPPHQGAVSNVEALSAKKSTAAMTAAKKAMGLNSQTASSSSGKVKLGEAIERAVSQAEEATTNEGGFFEAGKRGARSGKGLWGVIDEKEGRF